MKIRNIVFSGFMASILMAGGAYANATTAGYLTTKAYVDSAYDAAVSAAATDAATKAGAAETAAKNYADTKAGAAESAAKSYTDTLASGAVAANTAAIAAINDDTTGILAQAEEYADGLNTTMGGRMTSAEGKLAGIDTTVAAAIASAVGAGTSGETIDGLNNRLNTVETWKTSINASADELNILDGATVTTAELNILDGVTADATELNILDGATVSTTELNYVGGVTSNIQTQLDGKQATISDIGTIRTNAQNGAAAKTVTDTLKPVATTACELGKLCYVNDQGSPVVINTIGVFSASDLDASTGA